MGVFGISFSLSRFLGRICYIVISRKQKNGSGLVFIQKSDLNSLDCILFIAQLAKGVFSKIKPEVWDYLQILT